MSLLSKIDYLLSRIPRAVKTRSTRLNFLQYKLLSRTSGNIDTYFPLFQNQYYNLSIITSSYKSEGNLSNYRKALLGFLDSVKNFHVHIQIIIIANEPSIFEISKFSKLVEEISSTQTSAQLVSVQRETLYASWNRGIQLSTSDVICFWNMDDIRFFPALMQAMVLIKQGVTDFVYFPYLRSVKWERFPRLHKYFLYIPPFFLLNSLPGDFYLGPFFLASKILFEKAGLFDPSFSISGDLEWCCRAAKFTKPTLINKVAGVFFDEGVGLSTNRSQANIDEDLEIARRNSHVFS